MGRHQKTNEIIAAAVDILSECNPMTVRQVYYQLVSKQVIENNRAAYQAVSNALVDARQEGVIPWDQIEDRTRRPRTVSMWDDPADFAETCKQAYRRDVWASQPGHIETWLEKDALSGIVEESLNPYGVTLNIAKGYDGWSSIHSAAGRFGSGEDVTVLYFGDFDPSGEDMVRSLAERLAFFGCRPDIVKVALTADDIERYNLPPALAKKSDTRASRFIAEHGDVSVELDALPIQVLRERIVEEVESRMDMAALKRVRRLEAEERSRIAAALEGVQ